MTSQNRICFVFEKDNATNISIQIICEIPSTNITRQFTLLRSMDESLSKTIYRLTANIERTIIKEKKLYKHHQKEPTETASNGEQQTIIVELFDNDGKLIDQSLPNRQVWPNCRKLSINGQFYRIEYNAPVVIKFHFPDKILTNTITTAIVDIGYGQYEHSLIDWYVTDDIKTNENDQAEWTHVHRGFFYTFNDDHVDKFVRLVCTPRNNSLREGEKNEIISKSRIIQCLVDLPMNKRHQLTKDNFPPDSNNIRLVSYNILANAYATTKQGVQILYSHCSEEHIDHDYRKPLLLKEILGYHADIISLQECDASFFNRELSLVLKHHGYLGEMQIKSHSLREGLAIFYRADRFIALDSHNIKLSEYLRCSKHLEPIRSRFAIVSEINNDLVERSTVLQILALQRRENPDEVLLICNTHLYFRPHADITRLLQTVIASERMKEIKQFYEELNKNVSVIWSGDFNAHITSLSYHFLTTGMFLTDTNHKEYNEDYAKIIKNFDYQIPMELSTYSNYAYTAYTPTFCAILDHIFYQSERFQFKRSIPMPTHDEVTEFTVIPSCKIPSDHLAIVIELEILRS